MANSEHLQPVIGAGIHERFRDTSIDVYGETKRPFVAASIAKPYLAAAMLLMHEEGSFDLTRSFHVTLSEFRQGVRGTGAHHWLPQTPLAGIHLLRKASPDTHVTMRPVPAKELLERMIINSDNLATLVMVNAAGRQELQQVLDYWGMKHTTVRNDVKGIDNVTTAEDLQLFLHKLHEEELFREKRLAADMRYSMPSTPVRHDTHPQFLHAMHSMPGDITQNGSSFAHRVGFIEGVTGEHSFVVLTEGPAMENGNATKTQTKAVGEILESISGFIA